MSTNQGWCLDALRTSGLWQDFVRPEKWNISQVGFQGSNASGGRVVLLPSACWAHGASKIGLFRRISSTLYSTAFQRLRGHVAAQCVSHKVCFRQAHCFMQNPLHFLPVPPNPTCAHSYIWDFPKRAPASFLPGGSLVYTMVDLIVAISLSNLLEEEHRIYLILCPIHHHIHPSQKTLTCVTRSPL